MQLPYDLTIASLHGRYARGVLTPSRMACDVLEALHPPDQRNAWIYQLPEQDVLTQARRIEQDPLASSLPLYGIPFAIKDNIDSGGYPTSAACPAYTYVPARSATVVDRLLSA